MNKKEFAKEVGLVSAIISDTILKKFYDRTDIGYLAVVDQISDWAIEFVEKNKKTDWEDFLGEGATPLSQTFKKEQSKELICWDDIVIDYAYLKLEEYEKRHGI
jgi:hypothetical protein